MSWIIKIHYVYIVNLYPIVNVFDEYAVGFNKSVNNLKVADIESGRLIGLIKMDIKSPKDLLIPILLDNSQKKLLFSLEDMVEQTFTIIELQFIGRDKR